MTENFKFKIINALAGFVGLSQALLIYVASTYFKQLSGSDEVGIFYFVAYFVVFFGLLNFHKLVIFFGKSIVLQLSMLGEIAMLLILIFTKSPMVGIIALICYLIFTNLINVSLDIILETFSHDRNSGRIRGYYLTLFNIGFVAGPLLTGYLLGRFNFVGIFLVLVVLKSIILAVAFWGLSNINHNFNGRDTIWGLLKKVYCHKNILRIYYISFALEFFYALMVVYSPIYLLSLGLSWENLGYIFAVMLVPFVFFEYPLGWLADKKWGEKKMIIFFLGWLAATTMLVFLTDSNQVWPWMLILLGTRIGAASISVLRDSYFYKKIDGEDVDMIDFFRTAAPVGFMLATGLSAILLKFTSLRAVFILVVIVVLSALLPAMRLKNNLCEAECKVINQ